MAVGRAVCRQTLGSFDHTVTPADLLSADTRVFSLYPSSAMLLKPGDRVFIDGTREQGTVKEVHPHEIVVRLKVPGGHEDRRFAHEDLRLDPTLSEASNYRDR